MARLPARFDQRTLLLWVLAAVAAVALAVWDQRPRERRAAPTAEPVFVDIDVLEEQFGLPPPGDAGTDALP